jgi:hypothetical protein
MENSFKILIACEESQRVCKAFRKLGFEAYSCDILPPSGGKPEWHIQGDAIKEAYTGKYDLMIAHPPCTYLSRAGARWLYAGGSLNAERYEKLKEGRDFFMKLKNAPIKHIAVENPTPFKIAKLGKPDQIIQPYHFGDPYSKRTLLWLKNLPPLLHTEVIPKENTKTWTPSNVSGKKKGQKYSFGVAKNQSEYSKTFEGIANAMAEQWGQWLVLNHNIEKLAEVITI